MSSQTDGHMELPGSFNFKREAAQEYRRNTIDAGRFDLWVRSDMYASSYAKHHSPDSLQPRNAHIPGYSGFVPRNRAESLHAVTYANMTKSVLADPALGANRSGLATTGLNITREALIDSSKLASSHKYGKSELQRPHPAWVPQQWKTTTEDAFGPPGELPDPAYRPTDRRLQANQPQNKTSGYQQNRAYWDGQGWKPHPVLAPALLSSEYRDRFNPERGFHRDALLHAKPQLPSPQATYKYNL